MNLRVTKTPKGICRDCSGPATSDKGYFCHSCLSARRKRAKLRRYTVAGRDIRPVTYTEGWKPIIMMPDQYGNAVGHHHHRRGDKGSIPRSYTG